MSESIPFSRWILIVNRLDPVFIGEFRDCDSSRADATYLDRVVPINTLLTGATLHLKSMCFRDSCKDKSLLGLLSDSRLGVPKGHWNDRVALASCQPQTRKGSGNAR